MIHIHIKTIYKNINVISIEGKNEKLRKKNGKREKKPLLKQLSDNIYNK